MKKTFCAFVTICSIFIISQAFAGPPAVPPAKKATQAEMEAGVEPGLRSMSPLLVSQAIAAQAAEGITGIVDAAVGDAGDGDTTHAYSKNNIRDYVYLIDPDFNGTVSNLAVDAVDAITEIAAALKSGSDTTLITGTAGTNGYVALWNADGDLVDGYDPATKQDVLTEGAFADGDKTALDTLVTRVDQSVVSGSEPTLTGTNFTGIPIGGLAAAALVIEAEGISSNDNDSTIPTSAAVIDYVSSASNTNITPVDTGDENATFYPVLVDGATESQATETDGEFTFNPSTGILTATIFSGSGESLTWADGKLIDLSGITMSVGVDEGIALPAFADVVPSTEKPYLAYDAANNSLMVREAGGWVNASAGSGAATSLNFITTQAEGSLSTESVLTAGYGIDITDAGGDGGAITVALDTTEVSADGSDTWSDGSQAAIVWTFDISGTDHTMTAGNGLMTFSNAVTVTGALTANGNITDGTATWNSTTQALSGFASLAASGAVSGGTVSDGTVTLAGDGTITGIVEGGLPNSIIVTADIKDGEVGTADLAATLDFSAKTVTFGLESGDIPDISDTYQTKLTNSAGLYGALDDETGSGGGTPLAVFNYNPTLTGIVLAGDITSSTSRSIDLNNASADTTLTITNSDGTYEANLVVEGDITYYGDLLYGGGGNAIAKLDQNAGGVSPDVGSYWIYFDNGVNKWSENGAEKTAMKLEDSQTVTGIKTFSTDIIMAEVADMASTPSAGYGYLWVKSDTPSSLIFTDDAGTDYDLTAAASGDVESVGDCSSGACLDGTSDGGSYIRIYDGDSNYAEFQVPDISGNIVYTFPTATSTIAAVAGSDTYVTFNDGGSAYGGDAGFVFNKTTDALTLGENGQDGSLVLYNELGGTDYNHTIQTNASQTGAITTTLPASTGTLLNNALTSAYLFVGSAGGVATGVAMSGEATITNAGVVSIADTGVALTSLTVGSLLGVNSIDATGAVDMDYGSADITDHTFTSDGGVTIIDGATIDIGAAGVQMSTDGDGAISFLGLGDGSDESLTINLDDTSNHIVLSSSTGVTDFDFSAMNINTTGVIKGRASYGADITGPVNHNTTDTHAVFYHFTAAATATLDAAADAGYGSQVCYKIRDAAEEGTIDIDAAEKINLNGTAGSAGASISATGAGESICLVATTDTDGSGTDGWESWGATSGWSF